MPPKTLIVLILVGVGLLVAHLVAVGAGRRSHGPEANPSQSALARLAPLAQTPLPRQALAVQSGEALLSGNRLRFPQVGNAFSATIDPVDGWTVPTLTIRVTRGEAQIEYRAADEKMPDIEDLRLPRSRGELRDQITIIPRGGGTLSIICRKAPCEVELDLAEE